MDAHTRSRYTESVRAGVARVAGVSADELVDLGGFESFVHEAVVAGVPRIVKATWSGRRTPDQIQAELHFVDALAAGGAPVCRGLELATGRRVETVDAGECAFHVTAYEKAPGETLPRERWTRETFVAWGQLVGLLHRLATDYPGPPQPWSRPSWREDCAEITARLTEPELRERQLELVERIGALPRDRGSFGPMHTDLHQANIHWHEGRMRVFDFDDTIDFWFVSDLAIVLYYAFVPPLVSGEDFREQFEDWHAGLLEGYAREHRLPHGAMESLPLFVAGRELALVAVFERSIPEDQRTEYRRNFLARARERILAGRNPLPL